MKLTGLIAAPHTPCNADYSLNPKAVAKQAWHLSNTGVKGVFVGGTTGECHSYSTEERIELFKAWGNAAKANDRSAKERATCSALDAALLYTRAFKRECGDISAKRRKRKAEAKHG